MSLPPISSSSGWPTGPRSVPAQAPDRPGGEALLADAGVLSGGVVALTAWQLAAVAAVLTTAAVQLAKGVSQPEREAIRDRTLARLGEIVREAPHRAGGLLRDVAVAFDRGGDALRRLVDRFAGGAKPAVGGTGRRSDEGAGPPAAAAGAGAGRGPAGPRSPRPPDPPPPAFAVQRASAEDMRRLAELRGRFAELRGQARAGTVLTPAQIEGGWGRSLLSGLQRDVRALSVRPGIAAAQRAELASDLSRAQAWVAGRYRLTLDKALAGLLESGSAEARQLRAQAGVGQPYRLETLQALRREGGSWLTGPADAERLAMLSARIAQRAVTPAPGAPTRPGGAVRGDEAGRLEQEAAGRTAEGIERARRRVYDERGLQLPGGAGEKERAARALRAEGLDPGLAGEVLRSGPRRPHAPGNGEAAGVVGGLSGSGGGGRFVEYSQQQQWPQQSQRRRDAAPDPGRSWVDANRFMAAMTRAHDAEGRPMHLRLQPTASGDVSVVVDPSQLDPSAQAAYDRLEQHVGTSQLERALGVLIAGDGKEVGLHGLADVWRTLRPQEPLRGRTLVDLGRVLSGRGDFGTLDELAGLAGFQAGTYRGIFPFTENHAPARSWIGAHGTGAFGLGYMDDLPTGPPTVEQLGRSPWVLQHLRTLQDVYDGAVRHEPNRNRLPPDHQPWTGSQAPGFVDSAAAVHAFWFTLRSAGPTESVMPTLHIGENLSWDAAAERAPALDGIDFRDYPVFHEAVREGLREIMQPFNPVVDLVGSALLARRIAEQTFEDEALRTQLRVSLVHLFTDPRAIQAYGESKHFEQAAQSLVLDRLEQRMQLPLDQPWSSGRLRVAARQWAAESTDDPQTPLRRLRTLETLLNDSAVLSLLAAGQQQADIAEGRLFQRIEQLPRQFGFEPARNAPRVPYEPAASLHEAIANHLARHGVVARVRTGAVTEFIVDRAATSSWRRAQEINPAIAEMMRRLCGQLSEGGSRTNWRFRADSQ